MAENILFSRDFIAALELKGSGDTTIITYKG